MIENEFHELGEESTKLYDRLDVIDFEKHEKKNRYSSILPMSLTLVTLDGKEYSGHNYFNGNYVLNKKGQVEFIACQGPLKNTVEDFWTMIIKNKVNSIVGNSGF